jgi:hypothetical protein
MKEKQPPTNDEVVEAENFGRTLMCIMRAINNEAWTDIVKSPILSASLWRGMFHENYELPVVLRPSGLRDPNEGPFPTKS